MQCAPRHLLCVRTLAYRMRRSLSRLSAAPTDYLAVLKQRWSPAVPRSPKGNNIVADYAKGCWITDVHGRKFLDFQTGIGVANTGHCHPRCASAARPVLCSSSASADTTQRRGHFAIAARCVTWSPALLRSTRAAQCAGCSLPVSPLLPLLRTQSRRGGAGAGREGHPPAAELRHFAAHRRAAGAARGSGAARH